MSENNQILDVTYGSFSCRLEGFDDSVETMKLVVSYFHDLAGHDRFMDMDPQAPDMETLARLTEEQSGQSVDIEMDDGKLQLRAQDDDIIEDEDDMSSEPAVEAPQEEPPVAEETPVSTLQANVADKLQRLRAVAATGMGSARAQASEDFAEDLPETEAAAPSSSPLSQRLSDLVKRNVEEEAGQTDTDDHYAEDEDIIVAETDQPAEAPVMQDDEPEDMAAVETDDEDDAPLMHSDDAVAEEAADDIEDEDFNVFNEQDADAVAEAGLDEDEYIEDEIAATQDDDMQENETLEEAAFDDDADDLEFEDDSAEEMLEAEEDELEASDVASDDDLSSETDVLSDEEVEEEIASHEDDLDVAEEEAPLVLSQQDTVADAEDEEHDDYNDDDEFDLEEEVAKVEAEIAARKGDDIARHGLPRHVEDAMSRIMSQTDQHLNQPENRRHRDAFAQLKAAVAATEAARQLGDRGANQRDPDEAYKDDLGAHEAQDKGDAKSAPPLKLVKSQEVKPPVSRSESAAPSGHPLDSATDRLRKIATLKEAEPVEQKDGFAEFASAHGATDLVDRLEAAGAYICLVEGEADFSRPQVMKVVQSATSEDISREDGLRSFGRLLRQSRLIKLENGRFQIADNTQYRPLGDRAAQG